MRQKRHPWKIAIYVSNTEKEAIIRNTEQLEKDFNLSRNEVLREILTEDIVDPTFLLKNKFITEEQFHLAHTKLVSRASENYKKMKLELRKNSIK